MAKCIKCGKWGLFLKVDSEKMCASCLQKLEEERIRLQEIEKARFKKEQKEAELRQRKEEAQQNYNRMLSQIRNAEIVISDDFAPIILKKDQPKFTLSSFRANAKTESLGDFVAIDVETTGLRPTSCEIIEIAAVRFRDFDPVEKFVTLLSSKKPIPEDASAVNHITDEMLEGKPRFQQIAKSLVEFIASDNLVGHNLEFDLDFIMRYGADVTQKKRKYYDTLELSQRMIPKQRKKWDREYECYVDSDDSCGIDNHKLGTLCRWFGIYAPDGHRALGDALSAGFLFCILADEKYHVLNRE